MRESARVVAYAIRERSRPTAGDRVQLSGNTGYNGLVEDDSAAYMQSKARQGVHGVGYTCGVLCRDFGSSLSLSPVYEFEDYKRPAIEARPLEALAEAMFTHPLISVELIAT